MVALDACYECPPMERRAASAPPLTGYRIIRTAFVSKVLTTLLCMSNLHTYFHIALSPCNFANVPEEFGRRYAIPTLL